ncbi:hypothetical protein [Chryseobacterium proteolyticum]|uniref:hypothetical protein n=1 Tax=Chryseobacterium proteolyticum TaxID=118127 RepID=UPI003983A2FC
MKRIYYFPGLISAIIIPLLFWYYGSRKFEEINLNVLDVGLPAKIKHGEKVNIHKKRLLFSNLYTLFFLE